MMRKEDSKSLKLPSWNYVDINLQFVNWNLN